MVAMTTQLLFTDFMRLWRPLLSLQSLESQTSKGPTAFLKMD